MIWPFKRQDWRLVKTISNPVIRKSTQEKGEIYYYLFESNKGKRKIEYDGTLHYDDINHLIEDTAEKLTIYHNTIYPWLKGRMDPDIPTYNQMPIENTANFLKGKV
jgi:hypothetical protein